MKPRTETTWSSAIRRRTCCISIPLKSSVAEAVTLPEGKRSDDAPLGVSTGFETSVGMACKSALFGAVNRGIIRPGPASEVGTLVVRVRLPEFLLGIHDEGTMLRHRFTDGTALKHQQFAWDGTVDEFHRPA